MAAISVRDLDESVTARLKIRAARHGRSMEAEVRAILTGAVEVDDERLNLAQAIRQRFAEVEGAEVQIPSRTDLPRPADLQDLS
ncbi:FitA-like ribbon-helix-helix domain-containing protein [Flexivirga alba]|uniref:Plasmid stabilization protein n=1 Tax=Flexivirga alba TaxID=702742 RepID=A0ABW2AK82_9MICO